MARRLLAGRAHALTCASCAPIWGTIEKLWTGGPQLIRQGSDVNTHVPARYSALLSAGTVRIKVHRTSGAHLRTLPS